MSTAIVVVPTCNLCRNPRARCSCIASGRRIRNSDPIHPIFSEAETFIAETKYFGKSAHSDALAYIAAARQEMLSRCASGKIDGFTFKRIDEDAKRLVQRADAKLYATRQKLTEQDRKAKASNVATKQSSLETLARYRASLKPVNGY